MEISEFISISTESGTTKDPCVNAKPFRFGFDAIRFRESASRGSGSDFVQSIAPTDEDGGRGFEFGA